MNELDRRSMLKVVAGLALAPSVANPQVPAPEQAATPETRCCTWPGTNGGRIFAGRRGSNMLAVSWGTRTSRRRSGTCTSTTGSWPTHRI